MLGLPQYHLEAAYPSLERRLASRPALQLTFLAADAAVAAK
jgi:hypothetical protein